MKALPPTSTPTACRRWKFTAAWVLSASLTLPAWAAVPFTVNGNGTISDATTGLVWDQCPYGLSGSTCSMGTALLATWPQALAAAAAANAASYKGFTDWRVPNVAELESIAKIDSYTAGQPAMDTAAFPNTPISGDSWAAGATWTSTTYAPYPSVAWIVVFDGGYTNAGYKTYSNYVRLVRSGQSLASFDSLDTAAAATLINLSTRGQVLTGDNVMIGGFIIQGTAPKTVLIRAGGPSMADSIPGVLANPKLDLYSGQTVIASNDDWGTAPNAAAITATGLAPASALESAILTTLASGAYTAIVSGVGGTTGVGIIEVFEVDHPEIPLINLSTRGRVQTILSDPRQVQTGGYVMIGGFIIRGSTSKTVLIRVVGRSMANSIPDALLNPKLDLYSGQTMIASNDSWRDASNAEAITATGLAPASDLESAILITLSPGAYTAIVSGVGSGSGVALIEVFAQ